MEGGCHFSEEKSNENQTNSNDLKFSGILIMTPETESDQVSKKVYRIYEENTPVIVKNICDVHLEGRQMVWGTPEIYNSQETCTNAVGGETNPRQSVVSTPDNRDNIMNKITEFLKWGDKKLTPKPKNQHNHNDKSSNSKQAKYRLLSSLDENNQDSRDDDGKLTRTNSCHVCWDEYVECYSYPLESSMSTIDVRSESSKIDEMPRTRSQPYLKDDYFVKPNDHNKQYNNLDTYWKKMDDSENSYPPSDNSDLKHKCPQAYFGDNYDSHSPSNNREKKSNSNRQKEYLEWHNNDCRTKEINKSEGPKSNKLCNNCQTCGEIHTPEKNLKSDKSEEPSQLERNLTLRKLLGIHPEDKNVIVMLKL